MDSLEKAAKRAEKANFVAIIPTRYISGHRTEAAAVRTLKRVGKRYRGIGVVGYVQRRWWDRPCRTVHMDTVHVEYLD